MYCTVLFHVAISQCWVKAWTSDPLPLQLSLSCSCGVKQNATHSSPNMRHFQIKKCKRTPLPHPTPSALQTSRLRRWTVPLCFIPYPPHDLYVWVVCIGLQAVWVQC